MNQIERENLGKDFFEPKLGGEQRLVPIIKNAMMEKYEGVFK